MKIAVDLFRTLYDDVAARIIIDGKSYFFGVEILFEIEVRRLPDSVNAAVRASASVHGHPLSRSGKDGVLEFALHRSAILILSLPAVKRGAVIFYLYKIPVHISP